MGNEVIISAEGGPKALLQEHFPNCKFSHIPFVPITYPVDGNMVRHLMHNGLLLLKSIWKEHKLLQAFVREEQIDLVISDSRFGLWSKKVPSIFISHQIHIKSPVFERLINRFNRWVMDRYSEVWIPDFEKAPGLAGELSHPKHLPKNAKYIGPLSRFNSGSRGQSTEAWDLVAIVSGPEPQRSIFEAEVTRDCIEKNLRALILKGKPEKKEEQSIDEIQVRNHLADDEMVAALSNSNRIVSRSGYSTIMDLHALGLKAEYFPTPGQTEQEYLALLHSADPITSKHT